MDLRQRDDGSMTFYSDVEGKGLGRVGGPTTPTSGSAAKYRLKTIAAIPFTGATSTSNLTGSVMAFQLDPNDDVIIASVRLYITGTSPLCTISFGTASGAGVFGNNLIDGLPTTTPGIFDTPTNKGSSGVTSVYLTAGSYITATPLQGKTCATLAGTLYVEHYKA